MINFRPQQASSLKKQLAHGDNKLLAGSVAVHTKQTDINSVR